jgi:WD40 repeat protein
MGELKDRLAKIPREDGRWLLETLPGNLRDTAQTARLQQLLTDFDFMQAKLAEFGVQALIEDYNLAMSSDVLLNQEQTATLQLIAGTLRLSAHILASDTTKLAEQLLGRLLSFVDPPQPPLEKGGLSSSKKTDPSQPLLEKGGLSSSKKTDPPQPLLENGGLSSPLFKGGQGGSPEIVALLEQAKQGQKKPWFRPLTANLTPPGGPLIRTLTGHSESVTAVAITPDGLQAVSASEDETLKVWDLARGQELHTLTGHSNSVNAVAITPDGFQAVSASEDKTLKVWDLARGQELHTLTGHSRSVSAVAITPDGKQAVSASEDKTLKLWDLATGEVLATFTGEYGMGLCAVAADGVTVVAGDESGGVHFLRLEGV